jgi:polyhydroxyalkanoate synthase
VSTSGTAFSTPKDTLFRDGRGSVFRFRRSGSTGPLTHVPVLLVPSMLHQWYVLDLHEGASVAAALSTSTPWETYCFDWGIPEDEDRYVEWDDVVARLERAVRFVQKKSSARKIALVGYSMGATLAAIFTALRPTSVGALVNIAGPIDFSESGKLGNMVDPRWFDAEAMASAGNISALQMQAGFFALQPGFGISRFVRAVLDSLDPSARVANTALETWANDTIPFPAAAYVTYIRELYQKNLLVRGEHWVRGERVDLSNITCPHLSVVAEHDGVCPRKSTVALGMHTRSAVKDVLTIPGGHVGAVTGGRAATSFYPPLVAWLRKHAHAIRIATTHPESRL